MSNHERAGIAITVIGIVALIALVLVGWPTTTKNYGGVNAGTRTTYTTIDGNAASTTVAGQSGVYINPAVAANATSTLIAQISDIDDLTFFGSIVASSTVAATVGVQFQEADFAGCNNNTASTTWYNLAPYTTLAATTQLASSTAFQFNPGSTSTTQGFAFKVPFTPAQCVRALVYAPNTTAGNYQIWYGFAAQKKGYNNPN